MRTTPKFLAALLGWLVVSASGVADAFYCGRVVGTGFGPLTRCWTTTGVPGSTVNIRNRAILNCTWTAAGSYMHHDGNTTFAVVLPFVAANDGSGTHKFVGSPIVSTALGDASYGEQRKTGKVRWGTYLEATNLFYPETGWMNDLGNTTSCGDTPVG